MVTIDTLRKKLAYDTEVLASKAEQNLGEAWVRFYHKNLELPIRATGKPWVGKVHGVLSRNPVTALRSRLGVAPSLNP